MENIKINTVEELANLVLNANHNVRDGEKAENYQHTHNRVHYSPDSNKLISEEVCINEHGSCYGIGTFATIENVEVNTDILRSEMWTDIEA